MFELKRLLIGMLILLQSVIALAEEPAHFLELKSASNNPQTGYEKPGGSLTSELYLATQPILTEVDVIAARLSGSTDVEVLFNVEGTKKLSEYTGQNIGKPLAIIVDGQVISAPVILARIDSGRLSVHLSDAKTALELVERLPSRWVETAPDNKKSNNIRPPSDQSVGSPVDIVTRYFAAVNNGSDAAAYALVALHEIPSLKKLLADPLRGPKYRDLAGRIGAMTELSRSETSAFVHCMVDPNTPSATPITIGLMKDPITRRWVIVEF
jgi:hypothetical protein